MSDDLDPLDLRARLYSASLLLDSGGSALPAQIQALDRASRCHGPALTVNTGGRSNAVVRDAIDRASAGVVLVIATSGAEPRAYVGNILALAAKIRGVRGIVIDNHIRDCDEIRRMELPVFCTGHSVVPASRERSAGGTIGSDIDLGPVTVREGDFIFGDCDGVVAVPREDRAAVFDRADALLERELRIVEAIKQGQSLADTFARMPIA